MVCVCGHAGDTKAVDDEDFTSVFFDDGFVDAGGDEESVEVGATECAGGGFDAGDVNLLQFFAGCGVEADDAAAVAEGDPKVAVCVDGHAIWRAVVAVGCGIDGGGGVGNGCACLVVIVSGNFFGGGVDVVHLVGGGVPADAVGVGDCWDFDG